jgi:hypothetical protein
MITVILNVLLGITAGTLCGLIGIGGGVIIVPALVFVFGLSQHASQLPNLPLGRVFGGGNGADRSQDASCPVAVTSERPAWGRHTVTGNRLWVTTF